MQVTMLYTSHPFHAQIRLFVVMSESVASRQQSLRFLLQITGKVYLAVSRHLKTDGFATTFGCQTLEGCFPLQPFHYNGKIQ